MSDNIKTKAQLLKELAKVRRWLDALKAMEPGRKAAEEALAESEEWYRGLVDVAFDGVVLHQDWIIKYANRAYAEIFGYTVDEIIGKPVLDFTPPECRTFVQEQISGRGENVYETLGLKKDGTQINIETCAANCVYQGQPARLAAIRDITGRKHSEEALRRKSAFVKLLEEVAVASNEASSPEEAMQFVVDRVCAYTDWPVGHVYFTAPENHGELIPAEIWHLDDPARFKTFRKVTETVRLTRGIGLPGRVLAAAAPVWIRDVTRDANFPRAKAAADIGVKAGFGFPVMVGTEVAAVLEFFSDKPVERNEPVLELMAHVGTQLGRVIERKRAEEALRESEKKYRKIFENVQDIFYQTDMDGRIIEVSPSIERYSGFTRGELIGRTVNELYAYPEDRQSLLKEISKRGEATDFEVRLKNKQGKIIYASVNAHFLLDKDGTPTGVEGALRDITERKLRVAETYRLAYALKSVSECVVITNMQDRMLFFNDAFLKTYGYTEEELLGKHIDIVRSSNNSPEVTNQILPATLEGGGWQGELLNRRKDGSEFPIHLSTSVVRDEEGKPVALIGVAVDITERMQAEAALRESEAKYRALYDDAPVGYHEIDTEGRITRINRSELEMLGYTTDEMLGHYAWEFVAERDAARKAIAAKISREKPLTSFERTFIKKDGALIPVLVEDRLILDAEGHVTGIRSTVEDISLRKRAEIALQKAYEEMELRVHERTADLARTNEKLLQEIAERERAEEERRQMEAKMQHAQKLESLGILAGGIAHDFNNLLVGILTSAGVALMKMPPDSPARRSVERIEKAALRAAELTNQMLAYSGKGRFNVQVLDLSELVEEMADLLRAAISKKARLQFNFGVRLPTVEVDATQVRQVIMNLITNASEALGDQTGVITLSTGAINADRAYLSTTYFGDDLEEDCYVYLEVADTGHGMDTETREKIFDPFFTTKFTGRGLGLAAVLGIIRGHSGTIKVDTQRGVGTTFRVLFPSSQKVKVAAETEPKAGEEWRGSGTILVVDDEEDVRSVSKTILDECGFNVLTANDGREALQVFREHSEKIVAVLLDVSMPHMSSEDCLSEMRRLRRDVPVILSSGYAEHDISTRFAGGNLAGFIHKPYQPPALIEKVFQVLRDNDNNPHPATGSK
ncbi:MAG TPA: PAS domain S-box protein [Acidobacteriota bacterium]